MRRDNIIDKWRKSIRIGNFKYSLDEVGPKKDTKHSLVELDIQEWTGSRKCARPRKEKIENCSRITFQCYLIIVADSSC